ncbi:MAG TPA: DUF4442 domain-containing protein [Chitinophagaceae bacterium]|nr:DUF4442 domain-containing protein [Chitinophagaceae bacterium]
MTGASSRFLKLVRSPLKFRLFLLAKLPSAFFAGVRVRELTEESCRVSVPYKWFSQNPFRSTYFACLAMAGEMSTGILGMAYIHQRKPPVSMLVTGLTATYHKKATGRTYFTCHDGPLFQKTVEDAVQTGEPRTVTATSTGLNEAGELIAVFEITWSFKSKQPGNPV